jgi:hypothetical protein
MLRLAASRRYREGVMFDVFTRIFADSAGWMTVVGLAFIIGMPVFIWRFARKQMQQDERSG